MRLRDLPVPDTSTASAALELLREYSTPALVNHCLRSYYLAAALATTSGLDVDVELLWVAAVLHDLGLEEPFDSHRLPFEQAGGHVARVFTAGAGWPVARRDHTAHAIVAHMVGTEADMDPEGHLLDRATGLDISGRDPENWDAGLLRELVATYPRLDLAERLLACFRDQADRKPDSAAGQAIRNGLADRLTANPLADPSALSRPQAGA